MAEEKPEKLFFRCFLSVSREQTQASGRSEEKDKAKPAVKLTPVSCQYMIDARRSRISILHGSIRDVIGFCADAFFHGQGKAKNVRERSAGERTEG